MNIKYLDRAGIASTLQKLMKDYDRYYWAVAWGTENQFSDKLALNSKKIAMIIFGTDFYGTDPKLLERFLDRKYARIIQKDSAGTFHPKVYLFIKGAKAAAIVGSANFTNGAMTKNNEAAILIDGDSSDSAITSIKAMIEDLWKKSGPIDKAFLDPYTLSYNAAKLHRDALKARRSAKVPKKNATHKRLRYWTWKEFAEMARKDPHHAFDERLRLLQEARRIFSSVTAFSELTDAERKAIAGFLTDGKEHREDCAIVNWSWFGSMWGATTFKNLIKTNNPYISEALDHIPLSGEIRKSQFDKYVSAFKKAFVVKSHKGGVATASRLLVMKRPDTFISVNSQNRSELGKDLGFAPTTLNFEKYWNQIIIPIQESTWWQTMRPKGQDGQLWDNRSAMLDSIIYEGKN